MQLWIFGIMLFVLIFGGCAETPMGAIEGTMLPDGSYGLKTVCTDLKGQCHKKAEEYCPKGFDVIDEYKEGQSGFMALPGGGASMGGRDVLEFKCKP